MQQGKVLREENCCSGEAKASANNLASGSHSSDELECHRKKQLFLHRDNDSTPLPSGGIPDDTSPPSTMSSAKGKTKRNSRVKATDSESVHKVMEAAPVVKNNGVFIPQSLISAFLLGATARSATIELQLVPRSILARDAMARAGCDTMLRIDIQRTSYIRKLVKHYSKLWRAAAPTSVPNGQSQLRVWPAGDRSGHPGYGLDDASVTVGDICDRLFVTQSKLKLEYDWASNVRRLTSMNYRPDGVGDGESGSGNRVDSFVGSHTSLAKNDASQQSGASQSAGFNYGARNSVTGPVSSSRSFSSSSSSSPFSQSSAFFKAHEIESEMAAQNAGKSASGNAKRRRITPRQVP